MRERRRAAADRELAEQLLVPVAELDVVVAAHGLQPQRLAEPARAYEQERGTELLRRREVRGLVDVAVAFADDAGEPR